MKIDRRNLLLLAALVVAANTFAIGQSSARPTVLERNVRAGMQFLAGDALQGRGSGTIFERIAAEYIGSQFMQFGLEPAGEIDASGSRAFVQTVTVPGREALTDLRFGGDSLSQFKLGRDIIAFSIGARSISGELVKLRPGETARSGAVVLLMLEPDSKFEDIQPAIAKMQQAGAAAILMAETKEIRENWPSVAERKIPISRRGTLLAVSSAAAAALAGIADGTRVELTGTFAVGPATNTWNAMGKITGTDPTLGSEVILISSHLDHLGVRDATPGDDKIFNGADDDASGTVAVIELARALASGAKPKRTVYFVCFGSEEAGGHGARHFIENMPFPKEKLIANLEFEMIGRPDPKVGADELWLTGYERTDLGPELAKRGAKIVADPHPEQNFFMRSDNYQLARAGIIAQTVSSFGLHTDYHKVTDEVRTIDFVHMTRSINSMVDPVIWLANSDFRPKWNEGKRP